MRSGQKQFHNIYDGYYPGFIFSCQECWPLGRNARQVLNEDTLNMEECDLFSIMWG
jgi:hypothetical protein